MARTKTRLSVTLDPRTLGEAMRLTGSKIKCETIAKRKALDELVKTERRRLLTDALVTGVFATTEGALRRRRRAHARTRI